MNMPTLEDLRRNPELLASLHTQARLARSQYVHCLLRDLFAAMRPQAQVALRTAPCG